MGLMPVTRKSQPVTIDSAPPLIVFTDLDGTLLDHDSYDWQAAVPALSQLAKRNIPVTLVSSKTFAELADYRRALGLTTPVVAENGAAIHPGDDGFPGETLPGARVTRAELQRAYREVREQGDYRCKAFFELGIDGIMRETGLDEAQAERANQRQASEPVRWYDSDSNAARFQGDIENRGYRCVRGGRFMHVMGDTGKEKAVQFLIDRYRRRWPEVVSVSLGDGPNDIGMLETTDIAVVIPGRHTHDMTLSSQNRILRPDEAGPAGWNSAMLELLKQF